MTAQILTQARLKELLHYCSDTGTFTWLHRDRNLFVSLRGFKTWNARYSGEKAGSESSGRCKIRINRRTYFAHRLAHLYINGCFPSTGVDHINRDPLDNRWANLREADQLTNCKNCRLTNSNVSGVNGVSYIESKGKWRARVMVDRVEIHLGLFDSIRDAAHARIKANVKYGFHSNHGT